MGRLTEADTPTIRMGATPSRLTSAHPRHPHIFYRPDALPAAQPTASNTEGNNTHSNSSTCHGCFSVVRDGDAGDRFGVIVALRLTSRLVLKERPHVHAVLHSIKAATQSKRHFFDSSSQHQPKPPRSRSRTEMVTGQLADATGDFACLVFVSWSFIGVFLGVYLNIY